MSSVLLAKVILLMSLKDHLNIFKLCLSKHCQTLSCCRCDIPTALDTFMYKWHSKCQINSLLLLLCLDTSYFKRDFNTLLHDTDAVCSLSLRSKNGRLGCKGLNGGQGTFASAVVLHLQYTVAMLHKPMQVY